MKRVPPAGRLPSWNPGPLGPGGCQYLTYHRWATREQVLKAYPQFIAFLNKKEQYDPQTRFASEWYRFYRKMFQADVQAPKQQAG